MWFAAVAVAVDVVERLFVPVLYMRQMDLGHYAEGE